MIRPDFWLGAGMMVIAYVMIALCINLGWPRGLWPRTERQVFCTLFLGLALLYLGTFIAAGHINIVGTERIWDLR